MGTTPEIDVVLAKPLHAVVGLNRPGRPPQLSVVWFEWDGTTFRFSTLGSRAKYRRFTRDPHLSILVDDPETLPSSSPTAWPMRRGGSRGSVTAALRALPTGRRPR